METTQFHIAQKGLFSGQYFNLLKGFQQNNLMPMRSCPENARLVLLDPGVLRNFNIFYFWSIDNVTHFVGRMDIVTTLKLKQLVDSQNSFLETSPK